MMAVFIKSKETIHGRGVFLFSWREGDMKSPKITMCIKQEQRKKEI